MADRIRWAWLGIADHQGVVNVGGRVGAALGPMAFQEAFARLSGEDGVQEALAESIRLEPSSSDIALCHRQAAGRLRDLQLKHGLTVVVGGGNDYSHPQLVGIREALSEKFGRGLRLGCINIDAHLDLRPAHPKITSGSPFYLSIEEGVLDPARFVEFGIQRQCNAPALWEYARKKKIRIELFESMRHGKGGSAFRKTLKALASKCDAIVVSLDLDAAASAYAPGVSAPVAEGFSASEILEMMALAGQEKKVVSLGVYELNPEHDIDRRTAMLAAHSVYHFASSAIRSRRKRAS